MEEGIVLKKAGVIGAGVMGSGIVQVLLQSGWEVSLCDVSEAVADAGRGKIAAALQKLVDRGKLEEHSRDKMLSNLSVFGQISGLESCSIVIEATAEHIDTKMQLFRDLSEKVSKDCILASNTSSLSITQIASAVTYSERVIGMHFFNPAPVMSLVEVIKGACTSDVVAKQTIAVARDLGKTPIELSESAGFIVNRLLVPMINEAAGLFAENVADAKSIDTAMQLGCNHPMGPLALADMIGLDIIQNVMLTLQDEFGDDKYRVHPIIKKMVRAGHLGVKTKKGFYEY